MSNAFEDIAKKIQNRLDAAVLSQLTKEAVKLAEILKAEVPVGEGNLRDTTQVIPAERDGKDIKAWVTIGSKEYPYAYAVWKGITEGQDGSIHNAAPGGLMIFDNWPNGPDEMRGADGFFRFKTVKHNSPPNEYVERTMARYGKLSKRAFAIKVKDIIIK